MLVPGRSGIERGDLVHGGVLRQVLTMCSCLNRAQRELSLAGKVAEPGSSPRLPFFLKQQLALPATASRALFAWELLGALLALSRPIRPVLLCRELSPERWFIMSGTVQSIAN
jgi:hypothetical protein